MNEQLLQLLGIGGTALAGGLLSNEAYQNLQDIGEQANLAAQGIAQENLEQTQFQPFTVTSATGGSFGVTPTIDPETGLVSGSTASTTLGAQEQAIQNMLMGQAQNTLGGSIYGQQAGRTAAEQAYGLGGQFMQSAQTQPADINQLRGMFANQAAQYMPNQISQATQNLTMPDGSSMSVLRDDPRLQGLSESQMIQKIMSPQAPSIGQLGQQALGLGSQGLATQAPSDVEALRQQYGQLAGQAAGDVLGSTAGREADVYERIRATQRPEEQRQRLQLEERLFNQGRSGVSTNMYGGTPEQLAMAKAQEESQNSASLAAIQQAQSEQRQALGTAQTLGGMFGQQAGLSSNLQGQSQARAAQLSQLGLSANQIQSQLQSEGLGRASASASQAANLAKLAGGLQAQQAGLGAQMTGLGSQLSAQDMAMMRGQQQLGLGSLAGAYMPQNQLAALQQASQIYPQLAQKGQLTGAGLYGEGAMSGIEAQLIAEQAGANLVGNLGAGMLGGLFSPVATSEGGVGSIFSGLFG